MAVLAVLLLGALCGCAQLDLQQGLSWPGSDTKPRAPSQMTDLWTYTVLREPNQPGVRGFGGRVMFYGKDGKKPIKVDGTFTVVAFDATEADPAQVRPEKKYIFEAEKLQDHYSESKLGHSYSFWLPWDEVGGAQKHVTLIARFEAKAGETLVGEPSRHTLPGYIPGPDGRPQGFTPPLDLRISQGFRPGTAPAGAIQRTSYEEPAGYADKGLAKPTMSTSTIELTPSFTQQVIAGSAAQAGQPSAQALALGAAPWTAAAVQPTAPRTPASQPGASVQSGQPAEASQGLAPSPEGSAHSALSRFPARRALATGQAYDPVRRQPYRAMWPSRLPPTPRSWPAASQDTGGAAESTGY